MTAAFEDRVSSVTDDQRVWVVTSPRNDASGLVVRPAADFPVFDYHAAARRSIERARRCRPEAVAYAQAHPSDQAAGLRAFGPCQ